MNTLSCLLCGFNATEKLSFSRFPSNYKNKMAWLQLCNLDPETNVSTARLCCKHFNKEDFKVSAKGRRLLKTDVVPSIFFNNECNTEAPRENEKLSSAYGKPSNYFHSCIICGHSDGKSSYHRLPKNEDLRNKWLAHFNIDPADPKLNAKEPRICGKHFVQQSKEQVHCHRRRRKELPTFYEDVEIISVKPDNMLLDSNVIIDENSTLNTEMIIDDGCEVEAEISSVRNENLQSEAAREVETSGTTAFTLRDTTSTIIRRRKSKGGKLFPRYPNDIKSPDIERASPRIKRSLQISLQYIQNQRKSIASLQQQLRRANNKIKNLEDMLQYFLETNFVNGQMEDRLLVNNLVKSDIIRNK